MKWFKIHAEKWMIGSTRWELTLEERAIWLDFLALASLNDPPGRFSYHSMGQLSDQLKAPPKKIENAMKKFVDFKKIEVDFVARLVTIENWAKYQSEYLRQKPYRSSGKAKKDCNLVTAGSVTKLPLEGEGEGEVEEEVEREGEKNPLPPIPKYLDFKIKDQLREIRAAYREALRLQEDPDPRKRQYRGLTEEALGHKIEALKKSYLNTLEDYKGD